MSRPPQPWGPGNPQWQHAAGGYVIRQRQKRERERQRQQERRLAEERHRRTMLVNSNDIHVNNTTHLEIEKSSRIITSYFTDENIRLYIYPNMNINLPSFVSYIKKKIGYDFDRSCILAFLDDSGFFLRGRGIALTEDSIVSSIDPKGVYHYQDVKVIKYGSILGRIKIRLNNGQNIDFRIKQHSKGAGKGAKMLSGMIQEILQACGQ